MAPSVAPGKDWSRRSTSFDSGAIQNLRAVSPNGERIIVSRGSESTDVVLIRVDEEEGS